MIEIDPSSCGTKVRLSEQTKDKSFSISLHWSTHCWLTEAINTLLEVPLNQKFLKETRVDDKVICLERIASKRAFFVELVKFNYNGGKSWIIIPFGEQRKGWKAFIGLTTFYNSEGHNLPTRKLFLKIKRKKSDTLSRKRKCPAKTH